MPLRRRGGRGERSSPVGPRRSGPPDEEPWWDPDDQAIAEAEVITARTLGRGWRPVVMVNNVERHRALGDDPDSTAVESARERRVLTGLDEGRAWHQRSTGALVVVRSEVYADADPGLADAHRAAWRRHGEPALDATWRQRWHERERSPGWIEARWVEGHPWVQGSGGGEVELGGRGGLDWVRVEDHTGAVSPRSGDVGPVEVYEHLTIWGPRRQVTVVVRHPLGLDLDDVIEKVAHHVRRGVAPGPAR